MKYLNLCKFDKIDRFKWEKKYDADSWNFFSPHRQTNRIPWYIVIEKESQMKRCVNTRSTFNGLNLNDESGILEP